MNCKSWYWLIVFLLFVGCVPGDEFLISENFSKPAQREIAHAVYDWEVALDREFPTYIVSKKHANIKRYSDARPKRRKELNEGRSVGETWYDLSGTRIYIQDNGQIAESFGKTEDDFNSREDFLRYGVRSVTKHEIGHFLGLYEHDDTDLMGQYTVIPAPPIEPEHVEKLCDFMYCGERRLRSEEAYQEEELDISE